MGDRPREPAKYHGDNVRVRTRGLTTPGALHEGKPWRTVVYIEESEGPKGGRYWTLTLDCGHHAFRPIPRLNIAAAISPIVLMTKHRRRPPLVRTAPQRVRCIFCESEEVA